MFNRACFLIIVATINSISAQGLSVEGYFWRDFEGIVPKDALPGGLDKNGRPIYIGQVLYENKLIPGKIYLNDKNIYFHWGPEEQSTYKNVKILCTQQPEKFEWLSTKRDEVTQLTNKLLVKGGFEPEYFTYIGRIYSGEETTVGKVICRVSDCLGFFFTQDKKGLLHEGPFEVLSYNPSKNQSPNVMCESIFIVPS